MTEDAPDDPPEAGADLGDEALAWLVHLRSGRSTAADHEAFRAWRHRGRAHQAAAREAEALWQDLASTPTAAAYSAARIAGEAVTAGRSRSQPSRRAVLAGGLAAALAVAAVASGALDPIAGLIADYATRRGQRRQVRLPDGSLAHLSAATALSLDYSGERRSLVLHAGEALFEVAPDAGGPFVVTSDAGEVRALGTVFAVRRDGRRAAVVVAEGIVEIDPADTDGPPTRLAAGFRASFGPEGVAEPTAADVAAATAWTRGKLVFNKRPLEEVVAELERYHGGRIVILRRELRGLKVSGVFDLDALGATLSTLERSLRVDAIRLPLLTLIR